VRKAIDTSKVDLSQLFQNQLVSFSGKVVMFLGLLVALSQLGIQLAPVLAGLGIAGFIVGFALQDTLSNFASGMMILVYRPFDVGDAVEAGGVMGTVKAMNLVSTTITTWDNQKLVVPNSKIWGDVIRNITSEPNRRVDMTFGIAYADDIEHAERVLEEIVKSNELVLDDPEPVIRLHALGESSVDFIVRPWARTSDYWTVYWAITRAVKQRFDAEGISIPFPQRDVHLIREKPATG
jgi:small conductance mechanosensitive channel